MTIQQDDYSPRYVGDTARDLLHTFMDYQGEVFVLTDVNPLNMTFRMKPKGGVAFAGKGSWSIIDAAQGQAAYAWHADDVATAGTFFIQAGVPFLGKMQHFEIMEIEIEEPL